MTNKNAVILKSALVGSGGIEEKNIHMKFWFSSFCVCVCVVVLWALSVANMQSIKGEHSLTFYRANNISFCFFLSYKLHSHFGKERTLKTTSPFMKQRSKYLFCPILFLIGFLKNCRRKYWRWESQVNKIEKSKRQSEPMLNSREVSFPFFPPFICFMDPGSQKKTELILHHYAFPVL